MEEKFDKALASKMKNLFEEHGDEAYELGAWEAFEVNVYSSGSNPYRFLWIGLAACFLMAMSVDTIYNSSYDGLKSDSATGLRGDKSNGNVEHALDEVSIDHNNLTELKARKGEIGEAGTNQVQHSVFSNLIALNKIEIEDLSRYDFENTYEDIKYNEQISIPSPKGNGMAQFVSRPHKPLKVGFMVTSLVNQYEGAQPSLNFGGGVMMDIPLIRNLSLNTGIVVAHQNINLRPVKLENAGGDRLVSSKARLLSFDLPINLKYTFIRKKKREMFVTGGISSLAYARADFKETYQGSREVKSSVYNDRGEHSEVVATVKSQEYKKTSEKPFSTFDLGKLLNLSVGISVPIEEQLSLIVEPFIKYPLGNLTSKDIKFSSAGISLRLNMGLAKVN